MDVDCEKCISFEGAVPTSISFDEHLHERGLVTIDFFKLYEPNERGVLFRERCDKILQVDAVISYPDETLKNLALKKYTVQQKPSFELRKVIFSIKKGKPRKSTICIEGCYDANINLHSNLIYTIYRLIDLVRNSQFMREPWRFYHPS